MIDATATAPDLPTDAWIKYLKTKVYYPAQQALIADMDSLASAEWPAYRDAIGYYGLSRSKDLGPADRYACLLQCLSILEPMARSVAHASLLARVTGDLGRRYGAAAVLLPTVEGLSSMTDQDFAVPLVPAAERFDDIDPDGELRAWMVAAVSEHFLWHADHSSLQSSPSRLDQYDALGRAPFGNCEGTRRRLLFRRRLGLPPDTKASDPIYETAPDNLNADYWKTNFLPLS